MQEGKKCKNILVEYNILMSKESSFIIFCLEIYKSHKNLTGKEVLLLFTRYGVFDYIREFYDVLHTMGYNYINNDIDTYLKNRNARV